LPDARSTAANRVAAVASRSAGPNVRLRGRAGRLQESGRPAVASCGELYRVGAAKERSARPLRVDCVQPVRTGVLVVDLPNSMAGHLQPERRRSRSADGALHAGFCRRYLDRLRRPERPVADSQATTFLRRPSGARAAWFQGRRRPYVRTPGRCRSKTTCICGVRLVDESWRCILDVQYRATDSWTQLQRVRNPAGFRTQRSSG
jgi:hypothetical protein